MKVIVIGATGDIGRGVVGALAGHHEVLRASRHADDAALRVDIADPASIRALYGRIGTVDAVVCCAGEAAFGPLGQLGDAEFAASLGNKLMGQVNLVRFGVDHVADGGVFVLTAGIFGTQPPPGVPALAMVNGALESFARAASLDLPRGLRVVAISPPWLEESAQKLGKHGAITAAANGEVYRRVVEGAERGPVVYPA
ncbi:MAG: short chain dehydrogenase [Kofleriaceae bacterium]|nr:short chain dehydrogenase [Myxococcales bacterium]MCB9572769.1 short chain dehydrogenase [Kofleriaceae bacterium]